MEFPELKTQDTQIDKPTAINRKAEVGNRRPSQSGLVISVRNSNCTNPNSATTNNTLKWNQLRNSMVVHDDGKGKQ